MQVDERGHRVIRPLRSRCRFWRCVHTRLPFRVARGIVWNRLSELYRALHIGIERYAPLTKWPGHDVQVVQIEAWRSRYGMIAARHQHAATVANGHADIEAAVARVYALDSPPVCSFEAVIVQLFEIRFGRRI